MRKLLVFIFLICGILNLNTKNDNFKDIINPINKYYYKKSIYDIALKQKKDNLINSINIYIDSVAPKSKLKGDSLVNACEKYKVNICFVMAQAQLESHFGTTGVAKKTNSVWNVKAYDGRSAVNMIKSGYGFSDPNHSIEPYLILLTNKYLINRTEFDLMKNFTNINGKRYASCPNYENKLKNIYKYIVYNTNINKHYNEYVEFKYS